MREIAPGLRYWKAPHPQWNGATEWPEDVGCVYYEAADALALIDPLLPRGREESLLVALDRDVARLDRPVVGMLTARIRPHTRKYRSRRLPGRCQTGSGLSVLAACGRETLPSAFGRSVRWSWPSS
jgi:hypothetical protein